MSEDKSWGFSKCINCGFKSDPNLIHLRCPRCGGLVVFEYANVYFRIKHNERGIWRYSSILPKLPVKISLGEGSTPVTKMNSVLVKNERYNPTGSYADRASAIIASYLKSTGVSCVKLPFVRDYTRSLIAYLPNTSVFIEHDKLMDIDTSEALLYAIRGINVTEKAPAECQHIEYVNSLTIEGLKTITLELYERDIRVDYVVVPSATGILAYSLAKGLRDLSSLGLNYGFKVVAVTLKELYRDILDIVKYSSEIKVVTLPIDEAFESFRDLAQKGFKLSPLAALGYQYASTLKNSIVVLTMGHKSLARENESVVKKIIRELLGKRPGLSAYEMWKMNPQYTLRAYYKAVKEMELKKDVCFDYINKGRKRVKIYHLC